MKNFLAKNKLQIRNYIIHNLKKITNIKILIGFFPIILGIYSKLYSKYYEQIFFKCVTSNLPGVFLQPTKISYETFDQILMPQLEISQQDSINYNLYIPTFFKNTKKKFTNDFYNKKTYISQYSTQQLNFSNNFIIINTNINLQKKQKKLYTGFINNLNMPINTCLNTKNFSKQFCNVYSNIYFPGWNTIKNKTTIGGFFISAKNYTNYKYIIKNIYKKIFIDPQFNTINTFFLASKNYMVSTNSLQFFKKKKFQKNKYIKDFLNEKLNQKLNEKLNEKLNQYNNFLTLDELPIKINKSFSENSRIFSSNKNRFWFKFQLENTNFYGSLENSQSFSAAKQESQKILQKTNFFLLKNAWLTNGLVEKPWYAKKSSIFIPTKFFVYSAKNFLPIKTQNKALLDKNNKNNNKVVVLQVVKNLQLLLNEEKENCTYTENLFKDKNQNTDNIRQSENTQFSEISINCINFNTSKITLLQNLIKQYNLETNLTFIPYSKLIQKNKPNSFKNKTFLHQYNITKNNEFTNIYNVQQSLELLELFKCHTYIKKNTKIPCLIMSGYFLPPVKNANNIFKLNTTNIFLFHIKSAKNYLQLMNYTNFQVNFKKFLPTKTKKHTKQNFSTPIFFQNKKNKINFNLVCEKIKYIEKIKKKTKKKKKPKIYVGPALVQDIETNELQMKKSLKIENLINYSLGYDNPLTDHQDSFFGKNSSNLNSDTYKSFVYSKNFSEISKFSSDTLKNFFSCFPEKKLQNKQQNLFVEKAKNKNIFLIKLPLLRKKLSNVIFKTSLKRKVKKKENNEIPVYKNIHFSIKNFSKKKSNYIVYSNDAKKSANKLNTLKKKIVNCLPIAPFSELVFFNTNQYFFTTKFEKKIFFNCSIAPKKITNTLKRFQLSNTLVPFIPWPVNILDCNGFFNFNTKNTNLLIHYTYFPYFQKLIKENVPTKYMCSNIYHKNYSIYKNKFNYKHNFSFQNKLSYTTDFNEKNLFFQITQPISQNSWFFTTQFTVAFLLINSLQAIAKKYQQELKYAISILLENENKDASSNEMLSDTNNDNDKKNFKIIQNVVKNFDNVAGMDTVLPELAEITLFLQKNSKFLKNKNFISQKILLTGPPGTGKTFLIQAIAGEAKVPIFIESGSSLTQPHPFKSSSEKLRVLFNQARKLAPCIIFIDEIDTFCQARKAMMKNSNYSKEYLNKHKKITNLFSTTNETKETKVGYKPDSVDYTYFSKKNANQKNLKSENSNLLLQFLIELDAISNDQQILVFGATNREQILDTALTRPGRFNKIIKLKLPNKQKRIEIIKLYTQNLGFIPYQENKKYYEKSKTQRIAKLETESKNFFLTKPQFEKNSKNTKKMVLTPFLVQYFANLTVGLSAADLASAINQSSIKAIQTETIHTLKTVEYGIQSISGNTTQKNNLKSFAKINRQKIWPVPNEQVKKKQKNCILNKNLNKIAYYQAGKIIVHTLLKKHPSITSIRLQADFKNLRYHLMMNIFQKKFSQLFNKVELESRIIGFYAGKAGEFLNIQKIQQIHTHFVPLKKKHYLVPNLLKNKQNTVAIKQNTVVKQTWVKNTAHLKKIFYICQSNIGLQDSNFANLLTFLMLNKWYLYCKKISIQKNKIVKQKYNEKQILNTNTRNFIKQTSTEIENIINKKKFTIKENIQSLNSKANIEKKIIQKLDTHEIYTNLTNLKKNVTKNQNEIGFANDWYNIYGQQYQENENIKHITPDIYWTNNTDLKNLKFYSLKKKKKKEKKKNNNQFADILSFSKITQTKPTSLENLLLSKNLYKFLCQCSSNYFIQKFIFKNKNSYDFFEIKNNSRYRTFYTKNNLTFLSINKKINFILLQNKLNTIFFSKIKNSREELEFFKKISAKSKNFVVKNNVFYLLRSKILKSFNYKKLPLLTPIINWNTLLEINYDYIYSSVILICFNKSISIVNYNRELLDLFASCLLQNEIVREFQIKEIIKTF